MVHGLFAALSPSEDATLRLVAHGNVNPRSLREHDLIRLERLGLIDKCRIGISLSVLGQQRLGPVSPGLDNEDRAAME